MAVFEHQHDLLPGKVQSEETISQSVFLSRINIDNKTSIVLLSNVSDWNVNIHNLYLKVNRMFCVMVVSQANSNIGRNPSWTLFKV